MAWEDFYLQSLTAPDRFGGLRESELASGTISNLSSLISNLVKVDSPGVVINEENGVGKPAQAFWWDKKNLFPLLDGGRPYFKLIKPSKDYKGLALKNPFQEFYILKGNFSTDMLQLLIKIGFEKPEVGKKALTETDWSIMHTNWKSAENVRLQQNQAKQSEILKSVSSSLNTGKASWAE